jgi:UDP-glucose 4-epimerase
MPYKLSPMEGQRVLITGGLGFIGSNIAHKAVSLGAKVTVLDACLDPYGYNEHNLEGIREKVAFVKGDIRDAPLMAKAVKGADVVFNCAAQVSHVDSMKDPFLDIDINCRGMMTVLEAVRKHADKAVVVYAGTRGQVGKAEYLPIDEKHPTNPPDVYGIDKLAAEKYHLLYHEVHGLRTVSLRINNAFGPRHHMKHSRYGILNWMIRCALLGEDLTVYGDGLQTRDYSYVDDVVDALVLASQKPNAFGEVFFLGSGVQIPFIEALQKIVAVAGKGRITKIPWPADRKAIESGNVVFSFGKAQRVLGWKPTTPFEDGLAKTVAWYAKGSRLKQYM